jgi:two-component system, OmpR family, response regulator
MGLYPFTGVSSIMSSQRRILIVDDDPDTRDVLELALSLEGYHVEGVPDCIQAVRALVQMNPDVILLDYRLNGSSPQEFMSELRGRSLSTPVILISGEKCCAERAIALGIDYHLSKPFELDSLLNLIRSVNAAKVL